MKNVVVIGAGPGGLAAAKGAKQAGADRVIILERDTTTGGILNQCIHNGFGLIRYKKQLTGPEYAIRAAEEAIQVDAEIFTGYHVLSINSNKGIKEVVAISKDGIQRFEAGAVILATGCRERTRGAISIPGSRPAGVYTAGVVQNLVNIRNIMPGKRIVILGSGDVGMIMARRLTLEGAKVLAVVEVLPEPAGLARNVSQCLYDFDIPVYCSHTVSNIIGKKRVTAVEISKVDERLQPIQGTEEIIDCDTLVLSVGLIPENEVAETVGVELDKRSNGAKTDFYLQTNIPGIFSCGNSRKIMDLADFVSEQGELAGHNAVAYLEGTEMAKWDENRSSSMKKGFPEKNTVTCSLCPNGCSIKWDGEKFTGNKCPRGIKFAEQEKLAPKRILTTTLKVNNNKLLPVKTEKPVDKVKLPSIVNALKTVILEDKVNCGQEVYRFLDGNENIFILSAANI